MAYVGGTGLEQGHSSELGTMSGTASVQTSVKRTGAYGLRCNPTTTATGFGRQGVYAPAHTNGNIANAWNQFYYRCAVNPAANDEPIFAAFNSILGLKFELRINSSRQLVAYDSALSVLGTGSTVIDLDTWYRLGVRTGTGAAGAYEVVINGASELSGTGNLLTQNNAQWSWGKQTNRNGNTVDFYYDDMVISDSGFPAGHVECLALLPNANGTYQTGTIGAGGGSHWENVEERPPDGNTTYLLTSQVIGEAETEALQSCSEAGITGSPTLLFAKMGLYCARDTVNSVFKGRLRSGSTDSDTASASVVSNYNTFQAIHAVDPATGAAWTLSGLDGVEVGVVEDSADEKTRFSQGLLSVFYEPGGAQKFWIFGPK